MKLCLRLSSLFLLLFLSCGDPYKDLLLQDRQPPSAMRFQPVFQKALYRCIVDGKFLFKKFHLSGLLLFKKMEDSSTRVVFQNEMGWTFFDFEWDVQDQFKVNQIMPQLDKPAVIKTLQKDLQLLLMKGLDPATEQHYEKDGFRYDRFILGEGYAYYISQQGKVIRIENAGKKKVTTVLLGDKTGISSMPSSVHFKHHKANFTIQLTKIEDHADE